MAEKNKTIMRIPIMRIFEVIRIKKKEITAIYFFAAMYGMLQLSIPLGIQAIINFIQAYTFSTSLWVLIGLVVTGVAISGNLQITQLKIIERINQIIFVRYGIEYAYQIPKIDLKSVDGQYLPEMANRFFDTVSLQKGLTKLLLDLPTASIQIIFGVILLSFYSSVFIIFGILLLIILFLLLYLTSQRGYATSLAESDYKYQVASWLEELGRTVKTFKFSKGFPFHIKKADNLIENYLEARTSHFNLLLIQYWGLIIFKVLITASMLIVGAVLAINNKINIGQFVAAEIVIIMIMGSVEKFIFSLDNIYDVLTSVEKLGKILDKPLEKEGNIILPEADTGLEIKVSELSFSFKSDNPILEQVSFHVKPGQRVCIMGSEGAGKSMLLRLLTGSYSDFKGTILVNNIPIINYKLDTLRSQIGKIISNQEIFEGTLLENITLGIEMTSPDRLAKLASITDMDKYLDTLEAGYETILVSGGIHLSGSVVQKILLMRALYHNPRLLLIKEPWSFIDEKAKAKIQHYILNEMPGTTSIIISKEKGFAASCDQIIMLKNGKVVASGSPEFILPNLKDQ